MTIRRIFLLLFITPNLQAISSTLSSRPNILWILADDLGWGELEVFSRNKKGPHIETPNLNRFASEGMQFLNSYAGYSVCAPSRTTLFTGRHSGMFPKNKLSGVDLKPGKVKTVAEILKHSGYETALFGKSSPLSHPTRSGFDTFIGQVDAHMCHDMYARNIDKGNHRNNFHLKGNSKHKSRDLCMGHPSQYTYTADVFQNQAIHWLENYSRKSPSHKIPPSNPFFLFLSFTIPHAGGWTDSGTMQGNPVPIHAKYTTNKKWPAVEKDHASVVTYLDKYVGQLMSKLKDLGMDNNTIIFFASDNGAYHKNSQWSSSGHDYNFFKSSGGLRGHKRSMFEGGHRSPTLVRWPGHIEAGKISKLQWAFWDVLPTLAELAGISKSKLPNGLNGRSIVPTLLGRTQSSPKYLYFTGESSWAKDQKSWEEPNPRTTSYAIISGRWKGIVEKCINKPKYSDQMRLYDLVNDPHEKRDVSKHHSKQVHELKRILASEKGISCKCFQCGHMLSVLRELNQFFMMNDTIPFVDPETGEQLVMIRNTDNLWNVVSANDSITEE